MNNYKITNIGLGDLIFFSIFVQQKNEKGTNIGINISNKTLQTYRDNSAKYKLFCFDFLKLLLKDFNIFEIEDNIDSIYIWDASDVNQDYFNNPIVFNEISEQLSMNSNNLVLYEDYIVLFTKCRDLYRDEFEKISKSFYDILNNSKKQILIIGEQEIIPNSELEIHGEKMIYSLYDDYISNIKTSKIIDLTKKKYEFDKFSIFNLLNDFQITKNSFFSIVFGGGGFFCVSLFSCKLVSLTNKKYESIYKSNNSPNIFSNGDKFIRFIEELLNDVTKKK